MLREVRGQGQGERGVNFSSLFLSFPLSLERELAVAQKAGTKRQLQKREPLRPYCERC